MRNIHAALRSLAEHWQRAVLSGLGVAVASIAIILLVSIGLGVQKDVSGQVDSLGVNLLIVVPGHVEFGTFNPNLAGKSYIDERAADAVRSVPGVQDVAELSFAGGSVKVGDKETFPFVIATTPTWKAVHRVTMVEGRFFDVSGETTAVCVLGDAAKTELFGKGPAVGKTVKIGARDYLVVGVASEKKAGTSLFASLSLDNVAYIPLKYLRSQEDDVQVDRLFVQVSNRHEPKSLVKSVESALGTVLDRSQYSVLTQEDLLGLVYQVLSILSTLVVGLTSIALFVGGVGVMTVALMSVNERQKEIGVRKTVGARRSDIFIQFLCESVCVGTAGVCVGLLVSAVAIVLIARFTAIKPLLTPLTVATAFAVGVGVGAVFGLLPALKAARQDPVVSLRKE